MIKIAKRFMDHMISHALDEYPNESCGILSGRKDTVEKIYRITNTTRSPYRYLMDPQEFLKADVDSEENGWSFIAFYHSHTHSSAVPSDTDVRMARQSGYYDVHYILVSLQNTQVPDVKMFQITPDGSVLEREYMLL